MSLRIESGNAGQSLQVNGEEYGRPESDSSFTSSSESEVTYTVPEENDLEDDIQVIRRYDMPTNEDMMYSSAPGHVSHMIRLNGCC